MDREGEKLKGFIIERSRGKVSWIQFGEFGLNHLGIEVWCLNLSSSFQPLVWKENRRDYRVECYKKKKGGKFVSITIRDAERKL